MIWLSEKIVGLIYEVRIYLGIIILTIYTVQFIMQSDDNGRKMNETVHHIKSAFLEIQRRSILPLRLLNLGRKMEAYLSKWLRQMPSLLTVP